MNQRIYLRRLIYTLKQRYGQPLDVYNNVASADTDLTTGVKSVTRHRRHVRNAVVLPKSFGSVMELARSFPANAGRAFDYGGIFDKEIKTLLIDSKDANVNPESEFIIDFQRFETVEVQDLELAFMVTVKRAQGSPTNAIYAPSVFHTLRLIQTASAVVV